MRLLRRPLLEHHGNQQVISGTTGGGRHWIHMPERLTIEECRAKAAECRDIARRAAKSDHRTMLEHMAETWERIGEDIKRHEIN
jgi:hypothetical protein